jgi:high affinity Mn2+ porin
MGIKHKKKLMIIFFQVVICNTIFCQLDSIKQKKWSIHFQATAVPQENNSFKSPYLGDNSFLSDEPVRTSFTSTLFINYKAAKHTYIVFNPEAAGGKGLSKTLGIAGFPNGEIYRVGNPALQPFIARLYVEQRFPLSNVLENVEDDDNQIQEKTNRDYLSLIIGKFSIPDFFDDLPYNNDPRTQYLNWALFGSGAWDYPANTRGYTMGAVIQYNKKDWSLKAALTTVPTEANGPNLELKFGKAMGAVVEWSKRNFIRNKPGYASQIHAGIYMNHASMGNYNQSIKNAGTGIPDVTDSRLYGRVKWGIYSGFNSDFGNLHHFINASWSDGKNESWAFTEIDRSITTGLQFDGIRWKRKNDRFAIAYVANFLSKSHRNYLAKGGYGFIIGDGKLNYGSEQIIEAYYSINLLKHLFITPDYQFVINPGYNRDRGPVNLFALRMHLAF